MATQNAATETPQYTETLASELIRHLGYEGAVRTCSENHWSGVLEAVRRLRPDRSPNG